jgi:FKBP-type peptidyl-prolyl cis-trans isomerase
MKVEYFKIKLIALVAFSTMAMQGCTEAELVPVADDLATIEQHLADNNITAEKSEDDIYYVVDQKGAGVFPDISSTVTVHYKGYTLDGDIFDSSYDRGEPSSFPLTNVIVGWQKGIPLFREGGSGTIFIPSSLAYGVNPPSGSVIGVNEILVFDIELIEVK